jgi:galactose mutarotase-like enzyme
MAVRSEKRCQAKEVDWNGLTGLAMQNERMRIVTIPALGGKITSLIDLKCGREWLWQNPDIIPAMPHFGEPYSRHLGGWTECFPSIRETRYPIEPWRGTIIPDHGEIWSLPWQSEVQSEKDKVEIKTTVHGVRLPYRFERIVSMTANEQKVSMVYRVTNLTVFDLPFIWSAHPILQVSPGVRLIASLEDVTVYDSLSGQFDELKQQICWPLLRDRDGNDWDLSLLPQTEAPLSVKLYGRVKKTAGATLRDASTASQIHFLFDAKEITHLGIWLNFNACSVVPDGPRDYFVAVEPCIGAQDDLALAYEQLGDYGIVPAQGERSWKLDVLLS